MAKAFRSEPVALFVESPRTQAMSDDERAKLAANIALAEQLGAHMETVYGDDVAFRISEFARLSGILEDRHGAHRRAQQRPSGLFGRKSLVEQLIAFAPNLDIYIIPDQSTPPSRPKGRRRALALQPPSSRDVLRTLTLSVATAIGTAFRHLGFADSSIISPYPHGPADCRHHDGRICTIVSSVLSVVLYNFCFVTPLFSLASYDRSYLVTFGIMFATAMVAGELTARIADNARTSAENAFKTRVLLETNQPLAASPYEECARVAMNQLIKLLKLDVVFYTAEHGTLGKTLYESAGTENRSASLFTDYERAVAT